MNGHKKGPKRTTWRLGSHAWVISDNKDLGDLDRVLKTMHTIFESDRVRKKGPRQRPQELRVKQTKWRLDRHA